RFAPSKRRLPTLKRWFVRSKHRFVTLKRRFAPSKRRPPTLKRWFARSKHRFVTLKRCFAPSKRRLVTSKHCFASLKRWLTTSKASFARRRRYELLLPLLAFWRFGGSPKILANLGVLLPLAVQVSLASRRKKARAR